MTNFNALVDMLEHEVNNCKMRFSCMQEVLIKRNDNVICEADGYHSETHDDDDKRYWKCVMMITTKHDDDDDDKRYWKCVSPSGKFCLQAATL